MTEQIIVLVQFVFLKFGLTHTVSQKNVLGHPSPTSSVGFIALYQILSTIYKQMMLFFSEHFYEPLVMVIFYLFCIKSVLLSQHRCLQVDLQPPTLKMSIRS